MAEDAVLRISAEIEEYKRILAKIPGITQKEAKLASTKLANELSKGQVAASNSATKAAKKSAKAWTDSTGDTKAGFESMKQAAEAFGGQVGAAAGVAEKLGRSFLESGKAAGPVGAAFGAVALGLAGVALAGVAVSKALFDVVASADEAIERLEEIEGVDPLPPATIAALESWRQAALGAEASGQRLQVVVAGELANAFEDVVPLIAAAADSLADFVENAAKVKGTVDEWQGVLRVATGVLSAGTTEAIRYQFALDEIGEGAREAAKGLKDLSKETEEVVEKQAKILDQGPRLSDFLKFQAAQERALAQARAAAAKQRAADLKAANDFIAEEKRLQEDIKAIEAAAFDAEKVRNAVLAAESKARFDAEKAAIAEKARLEEEADEARRARLLQSINDAQMLFNAASGFAAELAAAQIQAHADVANRARNRIDTLKEERSKSFDGEAAMRTAEEQAAIESTRAELKAKVAARRANIQSARESARKAFKASKQLGRADVLVNQGAAVMKAFAIFGPPPSPAGIASAAAAVLQGATQISMINRQKPPQFHQGNVQAFPSFTGGSDEFLAIQRQGESTLSQRATEELGREAIDSLNKTGISAGKTGGATFVNVLDGRTISRAMQRDAARRGPSGALGNRGGPIGVQDVFGAG